MKNLLPAVLILLLFSFTSCEEDQSTICESGIVVHEFTDFIAGTYYYDDELESFFIRYAVPGTIDSVYDGYLCHELVTGFELMNGSPVSFTGKFIELPDNFELIPQFGGQEFFHLEVTDIKERKLVFN